MQPLTGLETPGKPLVLCLLCGVPASGKTTLARSMCEALISKKGWQCARISYDDIITQDFLHSTSLLSDLEVVSAQVGKETSEPLKGVKPVHASGKEFGRTDEKITDTVKAAAVNTLDTPHLKDFHITHLEEAENPERLKIAFPDARGHPELLNQDNEQQEKPHPLLSNWKQDRRELLLYVDCFLTSVGGCAPLIAPGTHSEALWESFVCCLEQQNLLSSRVVEAETPCSLQPTANSIPFCVVMDDNFYYQSMRYEVFQLARKHSAGFCQLFLDCPVEACLHRNRQRTDPLPDEIIRLMSRKMERPNPDKNPWEERSLSLDMSSCTLDNPRVTDLLQLALVKPVMQVLANTEQKESDRAISASNLLHQVDQALRRVVSQTMQRAKGYVPVNERKILAQELLHLKGGFLEKLRQGSGKESHCALYLDVAIKDAVTAFQDRADYIFVQHTKFFKENTET